jgi:CSLREA domain-containing protein
MRPPRSLTADLRNLAACVAVLVGLLGTSSASFAAAIQVNDTADAATAGDEKCTLREAIDNANADSDLSGGDCAAGAGADLVLVPQGTYSVSLNAFSGSPNLDILNGELTIRGADARRTVIEGIFSIAHGTRVNVERVRVLGAWNRASLTLSDCIVSGGLQGGVSTGVSATTTIRRCALMDNLTAISAAGDVRVENSLITRSGREGWCGEGCVPSVAAIHSNGARVILVNTTIADNFGPTALRGTGFVLRASVLSNPAGNCESPVVSLGHNLASDASCSLGEPTDFAEVDPQLAPPAQSAGSSLPSMRPLPGSPAIDALPPAACRVDHDGDAATPEITLASDLRGAARPIDGDGDGFAFCDIGAHEATACEDGLDNDSDGFVDLTDPGCAAAADPLEGAAEIACADGFDNDDDGFADLHDLGCASASDAEETDSALVCDDGLDNDGDSLLDSGDPGCDDSVDASEQSATLACDDAADNDGDSFIDRLDAGCGDSRDSSEQSSALVCDNGFDDDGDSLVDLLDPGCTSVLDIAETDVLTICDDGVDNDGDGFRDQTDAGCASRTDDSELDAARVCDDGIDNDGDGVVDRRDVGCVDGSDASERESSIACDDGVDNDGDGFVDRLDQACGAINFYDERGHCQDGVNNDSDGLVDAADPGCSSPTDLYEFSEMPCDDNTDNDGDGLVDMRDPACRSLTWLSERSQCQDGIDNDNDGRIDFDRGVSVHGAPISRKIDKRCKGKPWRNSERK